MGRGSLAEAPPEASNRSETPSWARGFSCASEGLDLDLAHEIATTYAAAYIDQFASSFESELKAKSNRLLPLLERWAERESDFDDIWEVSAGCTRRAVLDHDTTRALQHAAVLGLRLNALGEAAEWEIELQEPVRLRINEWLLPRADSLKVVAEGATIHVRLTNGGSPPSAVEFRRAGSKLTATGAEALPHGRHYGCQIVLLPPEALDGLSFGGDLQFSRLQPKQIMAKVRKSLKLLQDHAPAYLPWTQHVLRAIVPLHAQLSEIRSGSDHDKPGLIQASFPIRTVALAETWVHECSHQHLQILTRVGPVDDGSDPTLYYSPVRQMGRPISMILLAYHAFANVLLFYRSCQESGLDTDGGYIEINELRLIPQLRQLEEALRTTTALTDVGRALWEPLAERIAIWQ